MDDWQLLQRELERSRAESAALHSDGFVPETRDLLPDPSIQPIPCSPTIGRPLAPQTLVPPNDEEEVLC